VLALRRISAATVLDRPVTYTLLTRAWQAVAGVVTIVLIAKNFTPEVQGFFYTFASLVALQIFLELGLNVVIVNRASQEWSRLDLDDAGRVTGEHVARCRLAGLMQFVSRWYHRAGGCSRLSLPQAVAARPSGMGMALVLACSARRRSTLAYGGARPA
jgi:hypothetical protein